MNGLGDDQPSRSDVMELLQRIVQLKPRHATVLIAVDGLGGAGKSTLASALASDLNKTGQHVEIVHFDDFYLQSKIRPSGVGAEKPVGGDFDWQRLRDQVLIPLRDGLPATYERYDWNKDALAERIQVLPNVIVIVEGVGSSRIELASFYDLRVWVDCPRQLRLNRGIARDGEHSRERWELDWMPSEDRYLSEHRPDKNADVIVSGTGG